MKTTLALILSATLVHGADLPTAKQAVEVAKRRMAPAWQDKVVRVEGRRSDTDLHIRQWDVTFYDDSRVNNALDVRVEDGKDVSATTQLRILGNGTFDHFERNLTGYSLSEVIDPSRWKLDSDDAVAKALKQPRVSEVQITEVRLVLSKLSDGEVPPVWRVYLRARSKSDPRREALIGYIDLSAESGEVLRNETRVDKLLK